jgi:hypothetical protein
LLMLPVCSRLWLLSTRVTYAGRAPVLVSGRWQAFLAEHPDLPPSHHSLSRLIPRPTPSAARGRGHRASRRTSRELVADGDASGAGLAGPMECAAALLAGMVASASAGADYRIRPLPAHGHELGVFGQVGGRPAGVFLASQGPRRGAPLPPRASVSGPRLGHTPSEPSGSQRSPAVHRSPRSRIKSAHARTNPGIIRASDAVAGNDPSGGGVAGGGRTP